MFTQEGLRTSSTSYYSISHDEPVNVKVFFTYKGMPVNPEFIEEYPEIYPARELIKKKFEELKSMTQKGKFSFFTVTEEGLQDVEVNSLSELAI